MQEPMDKCRGCPDRPLTADSIIEKFSIGNPMEDFEDGLHALFICFVEQDEQNYNDRYKQNVIYTYISLRDLIKDVSKLQKSQKS